MKVINIKDNNYKINWEDDLLIGHAFGSVANDAGTGSYEAFKAAYDRGIRIFEVDLYMSSDNKVVLAHDFDGRKTPTEEEFLNTPILGKYTPLSFADLLKIMEKFPDIYIITDSKHTDKTVIYTQFNEMIKVAKDEELLNVLDRMIVQIYYEDMYYYVQDIYNFKSTIFTLYMRGFKDFKEFEQICSWSQEHNIKHITMWTHLYNKKIKKIAEKYNINIYVHTENDVNRAKTYIRKGVKGVYTDNISKNEIIAE